MGLRERKKAETRRRIAEAAHRLFGERGFQAVTVVEVARAAEVAEATLFNYFPTKEDLFYSGLEAFGARLVAAVRERPDGESALAAFRAELLADAGQLDRIAAGDAEALDRARTTARVIAGQPGPAGPGAAGPDGHRRRAGRRDRARRGRAGAAGGGERADGSAHRARRVHAGAPVADDRPEALAADVRARAVEALALLEHGLAAFAPAG